MITTADLIDDIALTLEGQRAAISEDVVARCRAQARAILSRVKKVNPKQVDMILDPAFHISGICPRRAGKSFAAAIMALVVGLSKPNAISIIVSLNKQQLRRIYFAGATSLIKLSAEFGLKVVFNGTFLKWTHENGSIGYLLGCEDQEQIEVLRGLEADLYIIDECKSFPVNKLRSLIDEVIDPQRSTRDGRLVLIGTPGFICMGPFYEATCPDYKDEDGRRRMLFYGTKDEHGRTADDLMWSCHAWTLQENRAKPKQWTAGLLKKKFEKWDDDHPIWLREYLGRWTNSSEGLVFRYGVEKPKGLVNWTPVYTENNPTGLPLEGGPWRLVAGLDFGYEAPTAFVLAGYSSKLREVRHVWDCGKVHLLPHEIAEMIKLAILRFGRIEAIYADRGNLGATLAEDLMQTHGLPIVIADKREKFDHYELANSAFVKGELKIIAKQTATFPTELEHQLLTLAWDIDDDKPGGKLQMGREGKWVEDKSIPNDFTDAFIYMFRGANHRFLRETQEVKPEPGTKGYYNQILQKQLDAHRRNIALAAQREKLGIYYQCKAPRGLRNALQGRSKWMPDLPTWK